MNYDQSNYNTVYKGNKHGVGIKDAECKSILVNYFNILCGWMYSLTFMSYPQCNTNERYDPIKMIGYF
jgi:hypothetical protein